MADYKDDIERYHRGELSPSEMHRLEKKALSDNFLADALEGSGSIGANEFSNDIAKLDQRVKLQSKKPFAISVRIAAAIVILFTVTATLYFLVRSPEVPVTTAQTDSKKAAPVESKSSQQEIVAPPPGEKAKEIPAVKEIPKAKKKEIISATENKKPEENLLSLDQAPDTPPVLREESESQQATAAAGAVKNSEEQPAPIAQNAAPERKDDAISLQADKVSDATSIEKESSAASKKTLSRSSGVAKKDFRARVIRGKVSAENQGYLRNATVSVKGTTITSRTDSEGNFRIAHNQPNESLVFSSEGFGTTEVDAADLDNINVQLSYNSALSHELVVSGASDDVDPDDPDVIYAYPEGGNKAFNDYLNKNVQYPTEAKQKRIHGNVTVKFTVGVNGSVFGFSVVRGIGAGCDEELIRLIKEGPSWVPMKQLAKPLRSTVMVRLKFLVPD